MYSDNENYKKLFNALKNNNYNEAEALLSQGAKIDHKNSKNESLLWNGLNLNNLKMMKWLLEKGLDINELNSSNESLISKSIINNNIEMLLFILEVSDKNINVISKKGLSPLMIACSENKKEIIEILISFGCNINIQNQYGNNALIIAADKSDKEIIELLIKNNADMSLSNNEGDTALIISVKYKRLENSVLLLNNSNEEIINKQNNYNSSVVSFIFNSMFYNDLPIFIIDILINKKANFNVNIFGERHSSPFLESIKIGNIEAFLKIIEVENINVNVVDSDGNDIFHFLCLLNYLTPSLLNKIISCGYNVKKLKSKDGLTPYYALLNNESSDEDIRLMIDIINDHKFINAYKTLPEDHLLDVIISNRMSRVLDIFIDKKVIDINKHYKNGNSILHKLTSVMKESEELGILFFEDELLFKKEQILTTDDEEYNHEMLNYIQSQEDSANSFKKEIENFINLIIRKAEMNNISINTVNNDGDTALMLLIASGQSLVLNYFFKNKPDVLVENKYGENSLCYALKYGRTDIFNFLLKNIDNNEKIISEILINTIYNIPENEEYKERVLLCIEENIEVVLPYINKKDKDGNTPLIIASALNEYSMVKFLLRYGALPSLLNNLNETALMHACLNENIEIVKILVSKIDNKADILISNNNGETVFDLTNNKNILNIIS